MTNDPMPSDSPAPLTRELLEAYCRTDYVVHVGNAELHLRLGRPERELAAHLGKRAEAGWAFLTAANPYSAPLPPTTNKELNRALREELERAGAKVFVAEGRDSASSWHEASWLAIGISQDEAARLARQFKQYAIVVGSATQPPALLFPEPELATAALAEAMNHPSDDIRRAAAEAILHGS